VRQARTAGDEKPITEEPAGVDRHR
jgi:hypothetical protein